MLQPVETPLTPFAGSAGAWRAILLKDETKQLTAAFKFRGVAAKLQRFAPGSAVVTASTGNHGLAVAVAARAYGLHARVYLPATAPKTKADGITAADCELIRVDGDYDRCEDMARRDSASSEAEFVPSFDDQEIIDGHKPLFDEIRAAGSHIDTIFVPVGGGGLIAAALESFGAGDAPEIVGVEWREAPAMDASLASGTRVTLRPPEGGPEGLVVRRVGSLPFARCTERATRIELVSLEQIDEALRLLWVKNRIRAERAGAAALAAALATDSRGDRTAACIVSGGNIDPFQFEAITRDRTGVQANARSTAG